MWHLRIKLILWLADLMLSISGIFVGAARRLRDVAKQEIE